MANPILRIRALRQERGLSLTRFAEIVGVSLSYLSEIETGRKTVNARRLQKFADALECEITDLFEADGQDGDGLSIMSLYSQLNDEADRALVRSLLDRLLSSQAADDKEDS